MKSGRFQPRGLLALEPSAFGMLFMAAGPPETELRDGVAVVSVRGPLVHHEDWLFDSYDAVKQRIEAALEGKPTAIVLSIDSPGGLVSGCFDTIREIRKVVDAAGVPMHAYVDGQATSAAYALACAADTIHAPETGCVGSIGVIDALVDVTAQDAMLGVRVAMIASGRRKLDGQPHVALSDDAITVAQQRVDELAQVFFAFVEERRGIPAEQIAAFDGRLMHGQAAVGAGLVDTVVTLDDLISAVAGGEDVAASAAETQQEGQMATKIEEALEALRKAAESDDEEEAKKAKAALAALGEGDDDDEESSSAEDDEERASDPPPPPSDDDEESRSEDDDDEKMVAAAERVYARHAAAAAEKAERDALLASRPDLSAETRRELEKLPVASVRNILKSLPGKPRGTARDARAAIGAQPTPGEGQGDGTASRLPPEEKAALDRAMGLLEEKPGVVNAGNKLILGASVPVKGA